jgi:LysM repeat protein
VCGKPTINYHRQRRCLHCGTPAAELAQACLMCGKPVDSLPLRRTLFGGSWTGIAVGVIIIVGLVVMVDRYQNPDPPPAQAALGSLASATATFTPTSTTGPTVTPTAMATLTPTPTPRVHVIESGETLLFIAGQYGVTVEELKSINQIEDERGLQVGQMLVIPAPPNGEAPVDRANGVPANIVYVVQPGDTIIDIALKHGTTMEAIIAENPGMSLDLIYPGEEMVVPLATPTPTPLPTATLTPTATPGPPYPAPALLTPADGAVVAKTAVLFSWTAAGVLAPDEFYVLQLAWPNGSQLEQWTRSTAWRMPQHRRPQPGPFTWTVTIMRQTGKTVAGQPTGQKLIEPLPPRSADWP